MNAISQEISIRQESSPSFAKLDFSPIIGSATPGIRPRYLPGQDCNSLKSPPILLHDSKNSPFSNPNSEKLSPKPISSDIPERRSSLKGETPLLENGIRINQAESVPEILSLRLESGSLNGILHPPISTTTPIPITRISQMSPEEMERIKKAIAGNPIEEAVKDNTEIPPLKRRKQIRKVKEKKQAVEDNVFQNKNRKKEKPFTCKYCKQGFFKAQALGGHMSRRHPNQSNDYNYKKTVRKIRMPERVKLYLAKKKFFSSMNYDYDDLITTVEGRMRVRSLMNRSRIKRLKRQLNEEEIRKCMENLPPQALV